jgi:hypothetical protein
VGMLVRMNVILGHKDEEDHDTNRRHETEQT